MEKTKDRPGVAANSLSAIVEEIRSHCPPDGAITFVSGNFDILHPGHLRLFNFAAEFGDYFVVGVNADRAGETYIDQKLRLESVRSIGVVNHAFVLSHPVEELIAELRPEIVVKGNEHAALENAEQAAVDAYGGKLLFSSGDARFSSLDLLHKELTTVKRPTIVTAPIFATRHNFELRELEHFIAQMSSLNVVVVGDLIIDRYITCEALGMSQEDPTIVVTPLAEDTFVGGAGIVAAHTSQLGARTTFVSAARDDEIGRFARHRLEEYGVELHIVEDDTRPTTLKQRFRADGKTLLRVNDFQQHEISNEIREKILAKLETLLDQTDALIFSDFSYGCLPQPHRVPGCRNSEDCR